MSPWNRPRPSGSRTEGTSTPPCEQYAGRIDLLLTDVVMPELSGFELVGRLTVKFPRVKVLYMSGYATNAIMHYGVPAPGISLLQKPFSPAALAAKVREVLDRPLASSH